MVVERRATEVWPKTAQAVLEWDGVRDVRLDEVWQVACEGRALRLAPEAYARLQASRQLLDRMVAEKRRIYGVTTGYGPLATEYIDPECAAELQRNLIYHLAAGVGPPLTEVETRAIMAARFSSLCRGHSAVKPGTLELLGALLFHGIVPRVPCMGTVGASGDLTPLAHIALAMMGEGTATLQGQEMPAHEALARCGLQPLRPGHKEGLALVNGTSAMTGIAALNGVGALRAVRLASALTILYAEVMHGRAEAFHTGIGAVRPHAGQLEALGYLQAAARDSHRLVPATPESPDLLNLAQATQGVLHDQPLPQDPYTIRCAPQILGAALDVISLHNRIVETELNSVTDNPLFFAEQGWVLHGGNFYGGHVALAADALSNALLTIAAHSERIIARVTDRNLNRGLPAFLQADRTGLQSGFMGAQVTATAVLAEMRSNAMPASVQSISTNANNQDVVSMGTIAARKTARHLDHLYHILAVEALVLAQAFELRGGPTLDSGFSRVSSFLWRRVRESSSFLAQDRPLAPDLEKVARQLQSNSLHAELVCLLEPNPAEA